MAKQLPCPKCREPIVLDGVAGAERVVCAACGAGIRLTQKPAAPPTPRRVAARPVAPPPPAASAGFEVVEEASVDEVEVVDEPAMPDDGGFEVVDDAPPRRPDPVYRGDDDADERPRRAPGAKRKPAGRKPARKAGPSRKLLLLAGGGGLLALGLVVGLILLLTGGGGGTNGDGGGGRVRAVAKARPAVPQKLDPALALDPPTIDAATWRVTPDPVPLAEGVKSAFPTAGFAHCAFSDPAAAKMLALGSGRYDANPPLWLYDLRQTDPRELALPKTRRTIRAVALSPSGGRFAELAFEGSGRAGADTLTVRSAADSAVVWSVAVPNLPPPIVPPGAAKDPRPAWVGFADEERVLVAAGDKLSGYGAGGRAAFAVAAPLTEAAELTPGRRWLFGPTSAGYQWFDTADGSPAGTIVVPAKWPLARGLKVDPDGSRAVLAAAAGQFGPLAVATLELGTGRVTGSKLCPEFDENATKIPRGAWCGDGLILFESGQVLHFESGKRVLRYKLQNYSPIRYAGYPPDRRTWTQFRVNFENLPEKTGSKWNPPAKSFLAASSLPYPADVALIDAAVGLPWPAGTPIRVESNGPGDSAHHEAMAEAAAASLAERGYPIDPSANVGVRVTTSEVKKMEASRGVAGRDVPEEVRRREERQPPPLPGQFRTWTQTGPGQGVQAVTRTVDETGNVGKALRTDEVSALGSDDAALLGKLRDEVKRTMSPGGLGNDRFAGLGPTDSLGVGIDGLLEPVNR